MKYLFISAFILVTAIKGLGISSHPEASKYNPAIFDFHNGFWINLHHDLYQEALKIKAGEKLNTIADPGDENTNAWETALNFYLKNAISRNLLFDEKMGALKDILESAENDRVLHSAADSVNDYIKVISAAAPYYRKYLWQKQQDINQKWINSLKPLLAKSGDLIISELSVIYQKPWPKSPMRVDVTNYASWAGAYTTVEPVRITASSVDTANQNQASLEVVFHEASHAMCYKMKNDIELQCLKQNVVLPRKDFWHAVLFYTTGEVIKRHLPDYIPYADKQGLWIRAWPMYIELLRKDWLPYINGKTSYNAAIVSLVKDAANLKK